MSRCTNLEKCGNFWKNGRFSGRIWPDWGNTAWADMAGLGSIGLSSIMFVTLQGENYTANCYLFLVIYPLNREENSDKFERQFQCFFKFS